MSYTSCFRELWALLRLPKTSGRKSGTVRVYVLMTVFSVVERGTNRHAKLVSYSDFERHFSWNFRTFSAGKHHWGTSQQEWLVWSKIEQKGVECELSLLSDLHEMVTTNKRVCCMWNTSWANVGNGPSERSPIRTKTIFHLTGQFAFPFHGVSLWNWGHGVQVENSLWQDEPKSEWTASSCFYRFLMQTAWLWVG